jgi:hypothetical protein
MKRKNNFVQIKLFELIILFSIGVYFTYLTYENIISLDLFSSLFFLFILLLVATFFLKTFYQIKYIAQIAQVRDNLVIYYSENLHLSNKQSFKKATDLILKKKDLSNEDIPDHFKKDLEKLL